MDLFNHNQLNMTVTIQQIISTTQGLSECHYQLIQEGFLLNFPTIEECEAFVQIHLDYLSTTHMQKLNHQILLSHTDLEAFFLYLGAHPMAIQQDLEELYLSNKMDRTYFLAKESCEPSYIAFPLAQEQAIVQEIGLGPYSNQMLAKIKIKMPEVNLENTMAMNPRVIFILDRSGSMREQNRLVMVKEALLNALTLLPKNTLVSIYFYDKNTITIADNLPIDLIDETIRQQIAAIQPGGSTNVSSAIETLFTDLEKNHVLSNPQEFNNLTIAWLTDGEDDKIKNSNQLEQLFTDLGFLQHPRLIALGMGQYNHEMLNGVAENIRFQAGFMCHIASSQDTPKLFEVLINNIGVARKKVILVIEATGEITHQDLNYLNAGEEKTVVTEINLPLNQIPSQTHLMTLSFIIQNSIYRRTVNLSLLPQRTVENQTLMREYIAQIKHQFIIAKINSPEEAEKIRQHALNIIPADTLNLELRDFRAFFKNENKNKRSLQKAELEKAVFEESKLGRFGLFNPGIEMASYQQLYSTSMSMQYSTQCDI